VEWLTCQIEASASCHSVTASALSRSGPSTGIAFAAPDDDTPASQIVVSPEPRRGRDLFMCAGCVRRNLRIRTCIDELHAREVFCVHHALERFNSDPRTHRRDTHIRGRSTAQPVRSFEIVSAPTRRIRSTGRDLSRRTQVSAGRSVVTN
jgi:hypothetical protein